jgi:hypothetical protein
MPTTAIKQAWESMRPTMMVIVLRMPWATENLLDFGAKGVRAMVDGDVRILWVVLRRGLSWD